MNNTVMLSEAKHLWFVPLRRTISREQSEILRFAQNDILRDFI